MSEVVSFCWGEMTGATEAGVESLSLICRSLTECTPAGWWMNGTNSAEQEELSVTLSWICPSCPSDTSTKARCSASLRRAKNRPVEPPCPGSFCSLAERDWDAEVAQILE